MNTPLKFLIFFGLLIFSNFSLDAQTDKKTILELFNATWCANCPAASDIIQDVLANRTDVIPVALHFGPDEPMNTAESTELAAIFTGGSAPGCMIDRVNFTSEANVALSIDENNITTRLNERAADPVEVSVSLNNASFDDASREMTITVNATFLSTIELTLLNFNLWIVEDLILTSDPAYSQAGGLSSNYPHRYVLRKMLGDEWGTVGAVNVPTVNNGDTFSYTYSYTIPDSWNVDQLKLIGLIQKSQSALNFDQRPILNATSIQLNSLLETGIEETSLESGKLRLYPNPSEGLVHIDFYIPSIGEYNLRITNIIGKEVYSSPVYFYNEGWQNRVVNTSSEIDLKSGLYTISVMKGFEIVITSTLVRQ